MKDNLTDNPLVETHDDTRDAHTRSDTDINAGLSTVTRSHSADESHEEGDHVIEDANSDNATESATGSAKVYDASFPFPAWLFPDPTRSFDPSCSKSSMYPAFMPHGGSMYAPSLFTLDQEDEVVDDVTLPEDIAAVPIKVLYLLQNMT